MDRKFIAKEVQSDFKVVAERLCLLIDHKCDCKAIAEQLQSDRRAIAKRLQSKYRAVAERLQSDCRAITERLQSD
jgi:hypothetical protein